MKLTRATLIAWLSRILCAVRGHSAKWEQATAYGRTVGYRLVCRTCGTQMELP